MQISNPHNLNGPPHAPEQRYGIRVTTPADDPFNHLLPDQWEAFHWYDDAPTRDAALADMRARHRFSRLRDDPTVCYEPVDR